MLRHPPKGCPRRPRKRGDRAARPIVGYDCETASAGIVLFLAAGEDGLARWIERTQPMVHFGWGIGLGLWRNQLGHTVVWTLALGPVTVHCIRAP